MKFIDLTGKKFGRMTVISLNSKGKRTKWNCICDCGKKKIVDSYHLRKGKIVSCGCYSRETLKYYSITHGDSKSRLYNIWCGMKGRCYSKTNTTYKNYGGRGITICEEWLNNFENFKEWSLKNGYNEKLTIDRIDVDGNYEPSNCRWATPYMQSNNTRNNVCLKYNNINYTAKELSDLLNINYKKFLYGYHKFNDVEKSIEYAKKYKKKEKKYEL